MSGEGVDIISEELSVGTHLAYVTGMLAPDRRWAEECPTEMMVRPIEIDMSEMTADTFQCLSEWAREKPAFRKLHFVNCSFTDECLAGLCAWVRTLNVLESVEFSRVPLGDEGVSALISAILNNPAIVEVSFIECGVGVKGVIAISSLLRARSLNRLCLCRNRLGANACRELAYGILVTPGLYVLRLGDAEIDDDALAYIVNAISYNFRIRLREFRLENNRITDWGCTTLNPVISQKTGLYLDLSRNWITDNGVGHLLRVTETHGSLILTGNPITKIGQEHISRYGTEKPCRVIYEKG